MKTGLGWAILLFTVLYALLKNPRWALFGMVACDNIRPGDEYIEFGMESVRFSITYYAVGLAIFLAGYRKYRLTSDRFHWAILFMFLSVVNSALHAPCWGPAYTQIDNYFKMLLQYYLIAAFIRNEGHLRELNWTMGLSMVVVGIRYCYGKFLLGEHRFEGATGDRNEMAMAMVMAWPLLFMVGLTTKVMWKRAVAWASLVPLMLSIVFCLSRGGMLGLIAVVGYVLYRLHHKRWLWVVGICGGLIGLANLPSTVTARFMSIGSAAKKDASAIGRLNAWGAAREMVRDRPFWGVGSGNFLVYFRRYAPDPNDVHVAHSSFYQLMGEQGLPGLIVWLYLVLMTWTVASWCEMRIIRIEKGKWSETRYMLVALKASWIGYVFCGAFLSQEDMDFFYHLVAITSRYTVFVREKELAFVAQQRALAAGERETQPVPASPAPAMGASQYPGWR
jgi:probable O-glycosylation ligase (exosortase A-associated)